MASTNKKRAYPRVLRQSLAMLVAVMLCITAIPSVVLAQDESKQAKAKEVSLSYENGVIYIDLLSDKQWNAFDGVVQFDADGVTVSKGAFTKEFRDSAESQELMGFSSTNKELVGQFLFAFAYTGMQGEGLAYQGHAAYMKVDVKKSTVFTLKDNDGNIYDSIVVSSPLSISTEGDTLYIDVEAETSWQVVAGVLSFDPQKVSFSKGKATAEFKDAIEEQELVGAPACNLKDDQFLFAAALSDVNNNGITFNGHIFSLKFSVQEPTELLLTDESGNRICTFELKPIQFSVSEDKDGSVSITEYKGDEKEVQIPESVQGVPVTSIADGAFANNETVEKVVLPSTVTTIGKGAFENCNNLEKIEIPETVTEIADDAFEGCSKVEITSLKFTAAMTFANQKEITFTAVYPTDMVFGDADGNGQVDASDALKVLKFLVRIDSLSLNDMNASDVDDSYEINATDALTILKKIVRLISDFEVEKK